MLQRGRGRGRVGRMAARPRTRPRFQRRARRDWPGVTPAKRPAHSNSRPLRRRFNSSAYRVRKGGYNFADAAVLSDHRPDASSDRRSGRRLRDAGAAPRTSQRLALVPLRPQDGDDHGDPGLRQRLRRLQLQRVRQGSGRSRRARRLDGDGSLRQQGTRRPSFVRDRRRRGGDASCLSRCHLPGSFRRPCSRPLGQLLVSGYSAGRLSDRVARARARTGRDVGRPRDQACTASDRRPAAPRPRSAAGCTLPATALDARAKSQGRRLAEARGEGGHKHPPPWIVPQISRLGFTKPGAMVWGKQ